MSAVEAAPGSAPRGGAIGAPAARCQPVSGGCSLAAAIAPPALTGEADLSELCRARRARRNFSLLSASRPGRGLLQPVLEQVRAPYGPSDHHATQQRPLWARQRRSRRWRRGEVQV